MAGNHEVRRLRTVVLKRLLPVAVLAALAVAFFALGLDRYVSFEALREHRAFLLAFVEENRILAVLAFVAIYAALVACSLPVAAVMTIAGGFLFGILAGTVYAVLAATLGATIVFVVAKTALGDPLRARAGPWMKRMEAGFQENALNYLLFLRLVALFPFFIVNLVPAFLGVRLRTYFFATLVGIAPAGFIYASVGAGLGSVFDAGPEFTPANAFTTEVRIALVGLGVLALLPVVYRKVKARRG
ncbi:MAG: TVP38/TMEM64 family protein [Alphaproteobacteria bacterium]